MAHSTSRVPSSSSSAAALAPPAPNWMPTSGFAFSPVFCTFSTSRSQSSVGIVMKPLEISMMSNPSSLHSSMYLWTASRPCVSTYSMKPPVETRTLCSWQRPVSSRTASRGIRLNEPAANLRESTYAPIVSRMSSR